MLYTLYPGAPIGTRCFFRKQDGLITSLWDCHQQLPWTFSRSVLIFAFFLALTMRISIQWETSGKDTVFVLVHRCHLLRSCWMSHLMCSLIILALSYLQILKKWLPDLYSVCWLNDWKCSWVHLPYATWSDYLIDVWPPIFLCYYLGYPSSSFPLGYH